MTGKSPSPEARLFALTGAEVSQSPFPYFILQEVLDPGCAEELLEWLERDADWTLHQGPFFEQFECNVLKAALPGSCAHLFEPHELARVRARVSEFLDVELTDQTTVVAHKLVPGQGIGLHNDDPHGDLETHRLVVHLGRDFKDSQGGHLVFFNSNDTEDIHRIFRPLHNTGVGFTMSQRSYHAVSDVSAGERYSVVFSFWKESRLDEWEVHSATDLVSDEVRPLLRFLQEVGTADIEHSQENLLSHLLKTYRILTRWRCERAVCLAGLFHSVYGTSVFREAAISVEARDTVRELIGQNAENLVYLYCVTERDSLYANLLHKPPYVLRHFQDEFQIPASASDLTGLLLIDAANTLEQFSRVDIPDETFEFERAVYERAKRFLPQAAVEDLRAAYRF